MESNKILPRVESGLNKWLMEKRSVQVTFFGNREGKPKTDIQKWDVMSSPFFFFTRQLCYKLKITNSD